MGNPQKSDHVLRHKYSCQKSKSKQRGIDFHLTYEEWFSIWLKSGKLKERGCKKNQYCMSRKNDIGPYSIDNVIIQLHSENTKEAAPLISSGIKNKQINRINK